jgi:amidohydrolase
MTFTVEKSLGFDLDHVREAIRNLQPDLVHWRRQLHRHPELSFREFMTADFVAAQLTAWGIEHHTQIAKTGIVATIAGNSPGKVMAVRADMDALPITEENDVDYRSCHEGVMHACGHDGHTAIALGLAYYLSCHRDSFAGTVKIIFQPAEEGPGGAKPMIEAGVLKNPDVDAMIGLHLWNNLPVGTVGVKSGPLMAAVENFQCTIQGQGGHGAIPQQTVDAIVVGAQVVTNLQSIVARNIDPLDAAVLTVGTFDAGDRNNVIADTAKLSGTVRYFNPALKLKMQPRVEAIIKNICTAYGATYNLDYESLYPPVINDEAIAALVKSCAEEVIDAPLGITPDCQSMASEDMSFFLNEVPGCYFFLGSANPERGLAYPHHHPRFNFDESVLQIGLEIFVRCIEKFLPI